MICRRAETVLMRSLFKTKSQRFAALLLLSGVLLSTAFLQFSMLSRDYVDPMGLDLAGQWQISPGKQAIRYPIEVPKSIPEDLRAKLGAEFSYWKQFDVPTNLVRSGEALAVSLGSIKGDHEVYWNGQYLGSGTGASLALYRVPPHFLVQRKTNMEVRVKQLSTAFPGIVHAKPLPLGRSSIIERQLLDYYFQTGIKPLIPAAFKAAAMLLFLGLCAFVPNRAEYFSFATFSFFSFVSTAMSSKFAPGYDQYHFRQAMIFLFSTISLSFVPLMSAAFLRLGENQRVRARIFGGSIALTGLLSALFSRDEFAQIEVYRKMHFWGALLAFGTSFVWSAVHGWNLLRVVHLRHRAKQVLTYSVSMLIALFAWTAHSRSFLRFDQFLAPELMDLGIFAALAFALLSDFRFAAVRSERVGNAIPKWFKPMLGTSRGANVTMEIPMLAMAVDTASYTRALSTRDDSGKEILHANIREALAPLTERYGAEKLSDRGDGGLYAWDLPEPGPERDEVIQKVLFACRALSRGTEDGLLFRAGLASGSVRGEWRNGDYSFMGDALNSAARLETIAQPGTTLVHESLERDFAAHLSSGWMEAEIKGLLYKGKTISSAS